MLLGSPCSLLDVDEHAVELAILPDAAAEIDVNGVLRGISFPKDSESLWMSLLLADCCILDLHHDILLIHGEILFLTSMLSPPSSTSFPPPFSSSSSDDLAL